MLSYGNRGGPKGRRRKFESVHSHTEHYIVAHLGVGSPVQVDVGDRPPRVLALERRRRRRILKEDRRGSPFQVQVAVRRVAMRRAQRRGGNGGRKKKKKKKKKRMLQSAAGAPGSSCQREAGTIVARGGWLTLPSTPVTEPTAAKTSEA